MNIRKGETEKTWFRTDRFFHTNEAWFFLTREGVEVGPFKSPEAANHGLNRYVEAMKHKETSGLYACKVAVQGVWASTHFN